jgi:hypothetical protein
MSTLTATDLIKEISINWREIYKMEREISKRKKQIKESEKKLFKICDHEWEYDTSRGPYERIKYQCTKCNLWKNPYMYN